MEGEALPFEPVGRGFAAAPRRRAREPFLGRQIEHQREIGPDLADRDALEAGDQRRIELARRALIGARRIGETIAK